ncbi:MAG: recombinase family protein [Bacilli bacterium]|nr:recombinase family protein [Bacilli bacterium]
MEKVAVYASFKNQNRKSIDFFLKRIADYCLMKNYDYTIYFDKVKSRLDLDRKELNNLKDDIENKEYSKVVIKDIAQLSRNTVYNMEFLKFLDDNNCQIESMDGLDLTLYKEIFNRFSKKKEEKER